MKRKIERITSVFGLLARSSFLKILIILIVMAMGELVLFRGELTKCYNEATGLVTTLEEMIEDARIQVFFLIALGLIIVILAWTEVRMSEKAGYTMMRLCISRKQLFAIKTVYNAGCLMLLFIVQIWLAIGMLAWYDWYAPLKMEAPQLYFITFYRNSFLHCLLPMQEIGKWLRNILMIAALSMGLAGIIVFPGEKGKNRYPAMLNVAILTIMWFVSAAGKNLLDMCCDILFLSVIVWELLKVFGVFGRTEAAVVEKDV